MHRIAILAILIAACATVETGGDRRQAIYNALQRAHASAPGVETAVGIRADESAEILGTGNGDAVTFSVNPANFTAIGHTHPSQAGRVNLGCSSEDRQIARQLRTYGIPFYVLDSGRLSRC